MTYRIQRLTAEEIETYLTVMCDLADLSVYTEGLEARDLTLVFGAFHEATGELAGFAALRCYHGFWCLRSCVVSKAHRGHHLQRRLIRARVNHVKAHYPKARHVNAWVSLRNRWSHANLESEGFTIVGDPAREFHGVECVKMRKIIR